MNNLSKIVKAIIVIVVFLGIFQVVMANRLTTAGLTLTSLEKQEKILREENEFLEAKIATLSSLTRIAQEAQQTGFVKPQLLYLLPRFPVALEQSNVNPAR